MQFNDTRIHSTHPRTGSLSLLMTLITCTGIAISSTNSNAIETNDTPSQVSTPVSLSNSQTRSLASAYNWLDRDSSIFSGSITPQQIFVEYQGLKERSEYLNVKVKTRVQMIEQFSREAARLNTPSTSASQTRGAAINQVVAFETRLADADRRIIEARSRLAPSLREAYNDIDMHSIKIPEGLSAEVAAEALMQTGDYEYVSMDWICYPTDTSPNDSLFNTQWHHAAARIDSVGAWDYTQGDPGTIIGVCDSGVDLDHPDLAAALVPGYNSVNNLAQVDGGNVNDDLNGHGTLVAGSAAAIGNNGTGVAGVGWNFGIMPIRVSNLANGTALLSEILEGARWASDNGAYTANCSFGGAEDSATRSTGGHIRAEGHLLVFAAGNDGLANQTNDWTGVTIVGASNQSDNWASFSHTGIGIDCIAPGVSIRSTNRTGGYSFTTGTSFSAPITAGAMMLIHDANPALTANEVEFMLLNTCDDKQALGEDNQTGWGRINVQRAVEDAIFGPSITSLPFEDTFPDDTLPTQWRNPVGDVDVSMDAVGTPSGAYSLNLDDQDSIESIEIRASALLGEIGEIHFSVEHRGVEAGENLVVEYFDILNSWSTLTTITSDGVDEDEFSQHRFLFPAFGLHENFKLRFVANGSDTSDDWYIDDVAVIQFENNSLPWEDNFEDGITLILDWESSTATASSDAMNAPDGPTSALLNNQDSMTSTDVDVSTSLEVLYYRFYTQHQGVESDETLTVEYKNVLGNWNPLMTITSDGNDQSTFTLQQVAFPFDAYGATSALRLTANGDESDDSWFVDSVAITPEFVVEVPPCPQDINEDGTLNFFDISAFLSAFSALDPVADFNNDGTFNFFDISTFLSAFSAGCP